MALATEKNPLSLYPEDLLSRHCLDVPWWVAHTKSRREKALAHLLAGMQVGYYLPFFRRRQANKSRNRYSLVCAFPGYLFFKGDAQARLAALRSNHVARVIEVKDNEKLLDELRQIYKALATQSLLYPHAFLKKGTRGRIKSGPLEGVEGIIDHRRGACRLVLNVSFLSQAVAVDVDAELVVAA